MIYFAGSQSEVDLYFEILKFKMPNGFEERLQKEHGWSAEYTLEAITEYKKFMFLGVVAPPVTPSFAIDEVWHLHLLYTKNYWNEWCKVLGKEFHHNPGIETEDKVKRVEDERFKNDYNKTIKNYIKYFGPLPLSKIWNEKQEWVKADLEKSFIVSKKDYWIVPVNDIKALYLLLIKNIKEKIKF